MNRKTFFCILLALLTVLSVIACKNTEDVSTNDTQGESTVGTQKVPDVSDTQADETNPPVTSQADTSADPTSTDATSSNVTETDTPTTDEPTSDIPPDDDTTTSPPIVEPPITEPSVLYSFEELNKNSNKLLSHASDNGYSALELDYRSLVSLDYSQGLQYTVKAYYPRLKKMANGEYILFFHNSQAGTSVYYTTSSDLKNWETPQILFRGSNAAGYYANCEALVLDNGDILVVCSNRKKVSAPDSYRWYPEQNGIVMKKSSNNGKSWSAEKRIYVGTNWEPYPIQLKSGEVQVYYTNAHNYLDGDNSSGTALIRSFDRGESWSSDINTTYSGQIVSQTATRVLDGVQLYSDQMPVAIQLLGSDKIMLGLEIRKRSDSGSDYFGISFSYSTDNWKTPLAAHAEGPAEKLNNVWTGGGPYLRQFVSGEIVCSYSGGGSFLYRMFDSTGKNYSSNYYSPFSGISGALWSSLEVIDSHSLIAVMENRISSGGTVTKSLIQYGKLNLNHSISSSKASPIIDGKTDDWKNNDEAIFIGSKSQAQASIRMTADSENLYLLFERLGYDIKGNDTVGIRFSGKDKPDFFRIDLGIDGVVSFVTQYDIPITLPKECVATKIYGTPNNSADTDTGFSVELKIPFSLIGYSDTEFLLMPILQNEDAAPTNDREIYSLDGMTKFDKNTWLTASVK